ncbi:MAG TPA: hypothetical protein VEQ87_07570 [Burkholderiales bacterium]|nr:hypothetical protein [Burkholderiales bacterium]
MKTLAASLSILAVAALAACSEPAYRPAMEQAAPIVPQNMSYRPGTGVVDNVILAPAPISSASGGTATGASAGRLVRLAIKMDSGGDIQYIDTDTNEFKKGDRVELTPDRMIRKM